ncbi:hypothetical protein [Streptomyces sp. A1277]|uniref:hypothetical protein n=1 Tax=Streptomyces sp. A1277 TaxID=2563103 RepID=UPI0026B05296
MPIGGFSTNRPDLPRPLGAESIATPSLWRLGSTPVRTAQRAGRRIHVIGLCGATTEEVQALADRPVPMRATWQWPGTYAVLEELDHERAGFKHAGKLREAGYWLGQVCDEVLMDALAQDLTGPSVVRALLGRV